MIQSPFARGSHLSLEQIIMDPDNQITQVSVLINPNNFITGIRFKYRTGDYIEKIIITHDDSNWETRNIHLGYQIVGMFVSGNPIFLNFEHFGFNLLPINRPPMP